MVWAILNPDQNAAFEELIHLSESDRIVAILGGAMLDDALRRTLEQRFRPQDGNTDMNDKLFRVNGPLGNLSPKIDLAYQLWMLDKPTRNAMYGISEIRNLFAHNMSMSFSLDNEKMRTALSKLTLQEGKTHYPNPFTATSSDDLIEDPTAAKDKFIVNLKFCLIWQMVDLRSHYSFSNTPWSFSRSTPDDGEIP
jgi:DNA-binding MltR family transcriptional regulator